jgi:hypothetical protein
MNSRGNIARVVVPGAGFGGPRPTGTFRQASGALVAETALFLKRSLKSPTLP